MSRAGTQKRGRVLHNKARENWASRKKDERGVAKGRGIHQRRRRPGKKKREMLAGRTGA